ncbi:hypothetical protein [Solimonas soli]|uniref:hypothetical protein n=1 Tax=Solimonas soli TaxID=413479 RepID=UPI00047F754E|nr:hypothetical protein [Solimonas soli]
MTGESQRRPAQFQSIVDDRSRTFSIDRALAELEVASARKDIPLSVRTKLLAILASTVYTRHRQGRARERR